MKFDFAKFNTPHRFIDSGDLESDSNCAVCGGKLRDSKPHNPAGIADPAEAEKALAELPEGWVKACAWDTMHGEFYLARGYEISAFARQIMEARKGE